MSRSDGMRLTFWWTHRRLNRSRILSRTGRKLKVSSSQQTHEAISSSSCQSSVVWVAIAAHRVSTPRGELICQLTGRGGGGEEGRRVGGEGARLQLIHIRLQAQSWFQQREIAPGAAATTVVGKKHKHFVFPPRSWSLPPLRCDCGGFLSLAAKTQLIFLCFGLFSSMCHFSKEHSLIPVTHK